jgi:hypothetical protein
MSPIRIVLSGTVNLTPAEIAAEILNLERWPEFQGYGPLPGIRSAEFERRTPELVGTRIRVTNTDGSCHVEEILEWNVDSRLHLRLHEFSPPLSRLARHFDEVWSLRETSTGTTVVRSMELVPLSGWTWPILWGISWLLRGALRRHLRQMAAH